MGVLFSHSVLILHSLGLVNNVVCQFGDQTYHYRVVDKPNIDHISVFNDVIS